MAATAEVECDAFRRRAVEHARAAECEVLERQTQRCGVGELAVKQEQARLEGGELLIAEVERGEEVVLTRQRVELFAGELVAIRLDRHAQREQLGAVGIEAAREGLVGHVVVALDSVLGVARSDRPLLGHDVCHERELADQLVRVMTHRVAPVCRSWLPLQSIIEEHTQF